MGQAIVYCTGCQVRLRDADFEKGAAQRIAGENFCARCAGPSRPSAPRPPAAEDASARRGSSTTRILHVVTPAKGTARFVEERAGGSGWIVGGVAGAALVVVLALLASAGGSRRPPPPAGSRASEAAVPAPVAPPPLAPAPAPPPRPDAAGLDALRKARDFRRIHPSNFTGQLALYERALEEAQGRTGVDEARSELEAVRRAEKERVAAEWPALERAVDASLRDEKFQQALRLLDDAAAALSSADWKEAVGRKARQADADAERLHGKLLEESVEARKRGDEAAVKTIRERVTAWGVERFHAGLDRALADAAPRPKPKGSAKPPPEAVSWRSAWEAALARAAAHDFAAALADEERAAAGIQDPALRAEAAKDVELLRLASGAHREARQILSRGSKGQSLRLAVLDPAGRPQSVEGIVIQADLHRIELRKDERGTLVDLGEVRGASLADVFLSRRPARTETDLAAAVLLCLLEGDVQAAARIAPEPSSGVPARYWEHARRAASPGAEEIRLEAEARRLFQAAEREFGMAATTADAVQKYARLLKDFAACPFVRRNAGFIGLRCEGAREFFLVVDDLSGAGAFRPSKSGDDAFWLSSADGDDARAAENHVEIPFSVLEGLDYRCWVWAGGCCEEALTFGCQGSEMAAVDPRTKETHPAEPGSTAWLPVRQVLSAPLRSHAAHAGRRAPLRWGWVQIPLPKYAVSGSKKVRVVTSRPGLCIAQALVSSTRQAPPLATERRELERARLEAREGSAARGAWIDPTLVGHWRLDEGKGLSAADASASGVVGSLRNGASWAPGAPATLLLGGKNDYVHLGTQLTILRKVGGCTLAAWVRPDQLAAGDEQNVVLAISKHSGDTPGYDSRATLVLTDAGNVEAGGRSADSDKYQKTKTGNRPVPVGRWTHVAATFDYAADRIQIYVNGVLAASGTVDFSSAATSNTTSTCAAIGSDDNGSRRYFDGRLSDVRVYTRALAAAELAALAAASSAPR